MTNPFTDIQSELSKKYEDKGFLGLGGLKLGDLLLGAGTAYLTGGLAQGLISNLTGAGAAATGIAGSGGGALANAAGVAGPALKSGAFTNALQNPSLMESLGAGLAPSAANVIPAINSAQGQILGKAGEGSGDAVKYGLAQGIDTAGDTLKNQFASKLISSRAKAAGLVKTGMDSKGNYTYGQPKTAKTPKGAAPKNASLGNLSKTSSDIYSAVLDDITNGRETKESALSKIRLAKNIPSKERPILMTKIQSLKIGSSESGSVPTSYK